MSSILDGRRRTTEKDKKRKIREYSRYVPLTDRKRLTRPGYVAYIFDKEFEDFMLRGYKKYKETEE